MKNRNLDIIMKYFIKLASEVPMNWKKDLVELGLERPYFFSLLFLILMPDSLDTYYFYSANPICIYNGMNDRISKIHCILCPSTQRNQHHQILWPALSLFYRDSCFQKLRNFVRPFAEHFPGNAVIIIIISFSYNKSKLLLWILWLRCLLQSLPLTRL